MMHVFLHDANLFGMVQQHRSDWGAVSVLGDLTRNNCYGYDDDYDDDDEDDDDDDDDSDDDEFDDFLTFTRRPKIEFVLRRCAISLSDIHM